MNPHTPAPERVRICTYCTPRYVPTAHSRVAKHGSGTRGTLRRATTRFVRLRRLQITRDRPRPQPGPGRAERHGGKDDVDEPFKWCDG